MKYTPVDVTLGLFGPGDDISGDTQQNGTTAAASRTSGDTDTPAPAAGEQQKTTDKPTRTEEERRAAFRALIDGEYRDLYRAETQRIIDRRFAETKQMEAELARLRGEDTAARAAREREGREFARARTAQWIAEGSELRAAYPTFSLAAEIADPQFRAMLRSGASVRTAYEAVHHGEMLRYVAERAAAQAAAASEKRITDNIRARGSRPAENGASDRSGFVAKDDVTKLTPGDMEEINRRVRAGERISFG